MKNNTVPYLLGIITILCIGSTTGDKVVTPAVPKQVFIKEYSSYNGAYVNGIDPVQDVKKLSQQGWILKSYTDVSPEGYMQRVTVIMEKY